MSPPSRPSCGCIDRQLATIFQGWRNHHDKDQPHARVLIPGKRASGGDLVIPRKVISHGTHGQISSGRAEGFVEGHVTTSPGYAGHHQSRRRIWVNGRTGWPGAAAWAKRLGGRWDETVTSWLATQFDASVCVSERQEHLNQPIPFHPDRDEIIHSPG